MGKLTPEQIKFFEKYDEVLRNTINRVQSEERDLDMRLGSNLSTREIPSEETKYDDLPIIMNQVLLLCNASQVLFGDAEKNSSGSLKSVVEIVWKQIAATVPLDSQKIVNLPDIQLILHNTSDAWKIDGKQSDSNEPYIHIIRCHYGVSTVKYFVFILLDILKKIQNATGSRSRIRKCVTNVTNIVIDALYDVSLLEDAVFRVPTAQQIKVSFPRLDVSTQESIGSGDAYSKRVATFASLLTSIVKSSAEKMKETSKAIESADNFATELEAIVTRISNLKSAKKQTKSKNEMADAVFQAFNKLCLMITTPEIVEMYARTSPFLQQESNRLLLCVENLFPVVGGAVYGQQVLDALVVLREEVEKTEVGNLSLEKNKIHSLVEKLRNLVQD